MSPDRPATYTNNNCIINSTHLIGSTNSNRIENSETQNMVVSLPLNVPSNAVLVLNNQSSSAAFGVSHQQNSNNLSKYLVIEPGQIQTSSGGGNTGASTHTNGGNIVVLATQQLDGTQSLTSATDEELTSLTWLQDKNLLKGINLSCAKGGQSVTNSPQPNHLSPSNEFMDDSCVSEENGSIISNSDNGIILSPVESNATSTTVYYSSSNTNNNNNGLVKNKNHRNNTMSPTSSISSSLSSPSSATSINLNMNGQIIEYQLTNAMIEEHHQQHGAEILGDANDNGQSILTQNHVYQTMAAAAANNQQTMAQQQQQPQQHQHFHKKYLREEHVKTLTQTEGQQLQQISGNNLITSKQLMTKSIKYEPTEVKYETFDEDHDVNRTTVYSSKNSPSESSYSPRIPSSNTSESGSPQKLVSPVGSGGPGGGGGGQQSKQKHPNNVAYDPKIHTHNKPPFSFSSLIFMAIEDSVEKALPVKEIYAWIVQHFPYFKTAPTGWKNSVRHNLSLSKSFQKVEKAPNMGKGSLWRVDQHYRHNLVQTVTRSQFHPCATIEKTSMKSIPRPSESPPPPSSHQQYGGGGSSSTLVNGVVTANGARPFDAELFPRLSKYMAEMSSTTALDSGDPSSPSSLATDEYPTCNGFMKATTNGTSNGYSNNNNNNVYFVNSNLSPEKLARDYGVDSIDDVNAATAMLALKHGPKIFEESFHSPIITTSPSEDHTYSQGGIQTVGTTVVRILNGQHAASDNNSIGTSSDAAYESSEEGHNNHTNINHVYHETESHMIATDQQNQAVENDEDEELRRHAEGADALLNLAGIASFAAPIILKRPSTSSLLELQQNTNTTTATINNNNNLIVINGNNTNQNYLLSNGGTTTTTTTATAANNNNNVATTTIYHHSPPKKFKTKTLRHKLKKKAWMR